MTTDWTAEDAKLTLLIVRNSSLPGGFQPTPAQMAVLSHGEGLEARLRSHLGSRELEAKRIANQIRDSTLLQFVPMMVSAMDKYNFLEEEKLAFRKAEHAQELKRLAEKSNALWGKGGVALTSVGALAAALGSLATWLATKLAVGSTGVSP